MSKPEDSTDPHPEQGIPLDLTKLSPDQVKLMRYILRQGEVTQAMLEKANQDFLALTEPLAEMLAYLVAQGHLMQRDEKGQVFYPSHLGRKATRPSTMPAIWSALETDPKTGNSPETLVNPELRRTRSNLTNAILAKLDQPPPTPATPPQDTPPQSARNLMDDLFSTGRAAMKRQSAPPPEEPKRDKKKGLADLFAQLDQPEGDE